MAHAGDGTGEPEKSVINSSVMDSEEDDASSPGEGALLIDEGSDEMPVDLGNPAEARDALVYNRLSLTTDVERLTEEVEDLRAEKEKLLAEKASLVSTIMATRERKRQLEQESQLLSQTVTSTQERLASERATLSDLLSSLVRENAEVRVVKLNLKVACEQKHRLCAALILTCSELAKMKANAEVFARERGLPLQIFLEDGLVIQSKLI